MVSRTGAKLGYFLRLFVINVIIADLAFAAPVPLKDLLSSPTMSLDSLLPEQMGPQPESDDWNHKVSLAALKALEEMPVSRFIAGFKKGKWQNVYPSKQPYLVASDLDEPFNSRLSFEQDFFANGSSGDVMLAKKDQNSPRDIIVSAKVDRPTAEQDSALTGRLGLEIDQAGLVIEVTDRGISVSQEKVVFGSAGESIKVAIKKSQSDIMPAIFLRDQSIASWSFQSKTLTAQQKGSSELFIVQGRNLIILPIEVGLPSNNALASSELSVPTELTEVPSGSHNQRKLALIKTKSTSLKTAIEESKQRVKDTLAEDQDPISKLILGQDPIDSIDGAVQLLDERTDFIAGKRFPVKGANFYTLANIRQNLISSAEGIVELNGLPAKSRFLTLIDDPQGIYVRTIAEFSSDEIKDKVRPIIVMRKSIFDALAAGVNTAQRQDLGSICFTLSDSNGAPVDGISLVTNKPEENALSNGPYFFNQYGYIDPSQDFSGPNGRACMFNVEPGPMFVRIFQGDNLIGAVTVAIAAGAHNEEIVNLEAKASIRTRMMIMPTVHEILGEDINAATEYRSIDQTVDLKPVGYQNPLSAVESQAVESDAALLVHHDRVFLYSEISEFEDALYSFDYSYLDQPLTHVTPLMPRGFVESLYNYTLEVPNQNSVVVELGQQQRVSNKDLDFSLISLSGDDVGSGYVFYDESDVFSQGDRLTKAVFFNVPVGHYVLVAESAEGYWLASDTVYVDNEFVSFIQLGSHLRN